MKDKVMKQGMWRLAFPALCAWLVLGAVEVGVAGAVAPVQVERLDAEQFLARLLDAVAIQDVAKLVRLVADHPTLADQTVAALRQPQAGGNQAGLLQLATLIESLQKLAAASAPGLATKSADAVELDRLNQEVVGHYRAGRHAEARAAGGQALALAERVFGGESKEAALALNNLGASAKAAGQLPEAETHLRRALAIDERISGPEHPAVARDADNLAVLLEAAGRYGEAEALYRRALAIREHDPGARPVEIAGTVNNLAGLLRLGNRHQEAEALYRRALAIFEAAYGGGHADVAAALSNLAGVLEATGRYGEAEEYYRRALAVDAGTAPADPANQAVHLNNLAGLLFTTGRHAEAEPLYRQVVSVLEAALGAGHHDVATALSNHAALLKASGRHDAAEPLYRRALAIDEQALPAGHADIATRLNNLAALLSTLQRHDEAETLYRRAMAIDEAALGPDHPGLAIDLNNLALLFAATGRMGEAEGHYRRAYRIALGADLPGLRWTLESNLSAFHARTNPSLAIFFGKRAIDTLQTLRGNLAATETRKSFIAAVEKPYHHLANLLIDGGRLAEAQAVLKMLKEEEYHDFLRRDGSIDASRTRVAYTAAERPWLDRLDALVGEGGQIADQGCRRDRLGRAIDAWFAEVHVGLAKDGPGQADGEQREAALARARDRLARLDKDAALLEYLMAGDRLHILVTTARTTRKYSLAVDGRALYRRLVEFRHALETPELDPRPRGRQLYAELFAPVDAELAAQGVRTLVLSLEGALRYIPFAALHDGEGYLAERYAVSLHTAAATAREAPAAVPWRLVALGTTQRHRGFSSLPGVKREIAALLGPRGLPGEAHLDQAFTAEQMRRSLRGRAPVLHVASHFMFTPGNESDSFLLLGDGERLSLRQMREGDFPFADLDLLTLSACETAMAGGREADGREVEGFGALAQNKGAAAVLATLWSIADASTPELMREFYSQRESNRISKAEALRQAQLKLIRGTRADGADSAAAPYAHPFFWAPFILMGNWL